jgi:hypothetical protein
LQEALYLYFPVFYLYIPESLADANQTAKNIHEYRDGLSGDVQNAEQELTHLEKDETNIVNLILQCNKVYINYLKGFANASRIKTQDGSIRPMISINLDKCIYDDELAARKVREYIGKILCFMPYSGKISCIMKGFGSVHDFIGALPLLGYGKDISAAHKS